jgi:hypothetical protein
LKGLPKRASLHGASTAMQRFSDDSSDD